MRKIIFILAAALVLAVLFCPTISVAVDEPHDPANSCSCCGNYNLPPCCIRCAMDLWWLEIDGN